MSKKAKLIENLQEGSRGLFLKHSGKIANTVGIAAGFVFGAPVYSNAIANGFTIAHGLGLAGAAAIGLLSKSVIKTTEKHLKHDYKDLLEDQEISPRA